MLWFWLSIPLAAVFFGAWYGIPLWMVLTRPDWGPEPAAGHSVPLAEPEPPFARGRDEHPRDEHPVEAMALASGGR